MPVDFEENTLARVYKYYMQYVVALFGYSWVFIQAARVLSSRDSSLVTLSSLALFGGMTVSYLIWGLMIEDPILTVGSTTAFMGILFLLISVFLVDHVLSRKDVAG